MTMSTVSALDAMVWLITLPEVYSACPSIVVVVILPYAAISMVAPLQEGTVMMPFAFICAHSSTRPALLNLAPFGVPSRLIFTSMVSPSTMACVTRIPFFP